MVSRFVNLWWGALRASPFLTCCCILVVLSVSLNVLLVQKLRSLAGAQSARISERLVKIGATVPPIAANRLGGHEEVIFYNDAPHPTVLYVFTPPCPWCARNLDNLKALVDKESGEYRFIGVSLSEEGLAEYVRKNQLRLPVFSGLSAEAKATYRLSGTPQTIVVSSEGRVLQNWVGAYAGDQKSQIEAFFHVTLPGLRELSRSDAVNN